MTKFKLFTMTALMTGLIAIPMASSQAGETGTSASTSTGASVGGTGVGVGATVGTNAGTSGNTDTGNNAATGTGTASGAITSKTYSSLDADRSGGLTESEFSKMNDRGNANFNALDRNGDNILTLSELNASGTASGSARGTTTSR